MSHQLDVADATIAKLRAEREHLRTALQLIGTDCEAYTSGSCTDGGRSPYAKYGAERWCDRCIARTALNGEQFPDRYTSGVEEVAE